MALHKVYIKYKAINIWYWYRWCFFSLFSFWYDTFYEFWLCLKTWSHSNFILHNDVLYEHWNDYLIREWLNWNWQTLWCLKIWSYTHFPAYSRLYFPFNWKQSVSQLPQTYRWVVRRPGDEDPLVSLSILGVQTVEDVAGFLRCEQRKQELIVILVPTLCWLSATI